MWPQFQAGQAGPQFQAGPGWASIPGRSRLWGFTPSRGVCGLRGFTPSPLHLLHPFMRGLPAAGLHPSPLHPGFAGCGASPLHPFTSGLRAAGLHPFMRGLPAAGLHPSPLHPGFAGWGLHPSTRGCGQGFTPSPGTPPQNPYVNPKP